MYGNKVSFKAIFFSQTYLLSPYHRGLFHGTEMNEDDTRAQFHARRSQKHKKDTDDLTEFLRFWDLHV